MHKSKALSHNQVVETNDTQNRYDGKNIVTIFMAYRERVYDR